MTDNGAADESRRFIPTPLKAWVQTYRFPASVHRVFERLFFRGEAGRKIASVGGRPMSGSRPHRGEAVSRWRMTIPCSRTRRPDRNLQLSTPDLIWE